MLFKKFNLTIITSIAAVALLPASFAFALTSCNDKPVNNTLAIQDIGNQIGKVEQEVSFAPKVLFNGNELTEIPDNTTLSFSIAPALPLTSGLVCNPDTGAVTGTPYASLPETSFIITASYTLADGQTLTASSNSFKIEIIGLSFQGNYSNVNGTCGETIVPSTPPSLFFKGEALVPADGTLTYSISNSEHFDDNFIFNTNTGGISGIPSEEFTDTFTVTASLSRTVDGNLKTYTATSNTFSITIGAADTPETPEEPEAPEIPEDTRQAANINIDSFTPHIGYLYVDNLWTLPSVAVSDTSDNPLVEDDDYILSWEASAEYPLPNGLTIGENPISEGEWIISGTPTVTNSELPTILKVVVSGDNYKGSQDLTIILDIDEYGVENTNIKFKQIGIYETTELECKIGNITPIAYEIQTNFNGTDITSIVPEEAYHLDFDNDDNNQELESLFHIEKENSQTLLVGSLSDALEYTDLTSTDEQSFPFSVSVNYQPAGAPTPYTIEGTGNIVAKNTFTPSTYIGILSGAVGTELNGSYRPSQDYTFNYHIKAWWDNKFNSPCFSLVYKLVESQYSITESDLNLGISADPSTGAIIGTPTAQSNAHIWVMVELYSGESGTGNVIARSWIPGDLGFVSMPSDEG